LSNHNSQGISQADQDSVIVPSDSAPESASKPAEVVEESQTVGFHWEPLKEEHQENMRNSIWGELEQHSASLELHQHEFSSLSTLFAKKASASASSDSVAGGQEGDTASRLQKQASRKGSMPKAIDMSR
jgi:hypothetical protein